MKRIIAILLVLVLLGGVITSCRSGKLSVSNAWARPGKAGDNSAVYFMVDNRATAADALVGVSCDAAAMSELHMTTTDAQGTSKMEHQERVAVDAGAQLDFQPGGLHVMLMDLKEDINAGDQLTVTLTFEKAGEVQVEAEVREP